MRIREPRTTALIFSSGKMVCTGAKRCVLCYIEVLANKIDFISTFTVHVHSKRCLASCHEYFDLKKLRLTNPV